MKMPACLFLIFMFLFGVTAAWAIPAGFNVQGRLTDANGVNKDGTFSIKFSVFETNSGGSPKWEKTMTSVVVKNGNFQVVLAGADDNSNQLEEKVKDLGEAYVELKVGNDPPLVPRQMLLRSPFSVPAVVSGQNDVLIEAVTGRIAMRTGSAESLTVSNNGNVGIGTNSPEEKLSVAGNLAVNGAISADNLVGSVMHFVTAVCPAGWIAADGRTVVDSNYPKLAAAMGKTGSFALPDLRGVFVRGWDSGEREPNGIDNGRALGSYQEDDLKSHSHGGTLKFATGQFINFTSSHWYGAYVGPTDTFGGTETRPKNISLLTCIKH